MAKDRVLRGQQTLADGRNALNRWYRTYQFPRLTLPQHFKDSDKIVTEMLRELLNCRNPETHQYLVDLFRETSKRICAENYHPATRVNAAVVLTMLNVSEEVAAQRIPPVPDAATFDFMLKEIANPKQLDAVKAVLLVGIRRHVRVGTANLQRPLSPVQRRAARDALSTVWQQKEPPSGRSPEAHAWMRRRALESLALLADVKDDPSLLNEMAQTLVDESVPVSLKCTSARCFSLIHFPSDARIDPLPMVKRIGQFVVAVVEREVKTEEESKDGSGGSESAAPSGPMPGMPGGAPGGVPGGAMPGMPGGAPGGAMPGMPGGAPGGAMPGIPGGAPGGAMPGMPGGAMPG